jgi:hypothetical protein
LAFYRFIRGFIGVPGTTHLEVAARAIFGSDHLARHIRSRLAATALQFGALT